MGPRVFMSVSVCVSHVRACGLCALICACVPPRSAGLDTPALEHGAAELARVHRAEFVWGRYFEDRVV